MTLLNLRVVSVPGWTRTGIRLCELMLNELADSIISISSSDADVNSTSKAITLLATLYNMRSDPTEKIKLLVKMIQLAVSSDGSSTLLEADNSVLRKLIDPKQLVTMLDEWNIEPVGRRELYRAAAEGSLKSKVTQQHFTLLVVETYSQSDLDVSGLESAKQAAMGAIRDPISLFVEQRKILSLPAVQALEKSNGKLFFPSYCLVRAWY